LNALGQVVAWIVGKALRPALPSSTSHMEIARFGGFLGRKSDGEPGVKSIGKDCSASWTSPWAFELRESGLVVYNGMTLSATAILYNG
jgi:hypothetical protein